MPFFRNLIKRAARLCGCIPSKADKLDSSDESDNADLMDQQSYVFKRANYTPRPLFSRRNSTENNRNRVDRALNQLYDLRLEIRLTQDVIDKLEERVLRLELSDKESTSLTELSSISHLSECHSVSTCASVYGGSKNDQTSSEPASTCSSDEELQNLAQTLHFSSSSNNIPVLMFTKETCVLTLERYIT